MVLFLKWEYSDSRRDLVDKTFVIWLTFQTESEWKLLKIDSKTSSNVYYGRYYLIQYLQPTTHSPTDI